MGGDLTTGESTDGTDRFEGAGRRSAKLIAATMVILFLGGLIQVLVPSGDASLPDTIPAVPEVSPVVSLDVFEPFRGRIVYVADGKLRAVHPTDLTGVVTLTIPEPQADPSWNSAARLAAVGWSNNGSILALDNEYTNESYLMDLTGTVTRIPWGGVRGYQYDCCWFVTSNWLSPDGSLAAKVGPRDVSILDLKRNVVVFTAELDRSQFPLDEDVGLYSPVWSPDGSEIAFIANHIHGERLEPTIQMMDIESGATTELAGPVFGHIRQLSWSPDGSTLLAVAGPRSLPVPAGLVGPFADPIPTNLYLIDLGGSVPPRSIATGHFVAAAWSPSGSQIAAIDYPSAHRLVLMNADGTEEQIIADLPSGREGLFTGVIWQPEPIRFD